MSHHTCHNSRRHAGVKSDRQIFVVEYNFSPYGQTGIRIFADAKKVSAEMR